MYFDATGSQTNENTAYLERQTLYIVDHIKHTLVGEFPLIAGCRGVEHKALWGH